MPFANFKVLEKTLTPEQKEEIVTRTTEPIGSVRCAAVIAFWS